ncbi:hypothetical protein [Thalassotalea piscium]|uniref:hypothetical protein n=1 Tax=Thalassotalea piscium TaxID=1230533 RepID=UPI0031E86834
MFSSLFAFRLPGIGNSSYWSLALILGSLLLVNNSFSNVKLLVKQKVFYSPIIILLLAALSAFLIPIFHQTYDISMVKTWVNNLFAYIGMSVLACIVVSADARYKNIFKIVFVVLITQAVFVWLMMAIAPLRDLIQGLTKDAATMARMEEYGGARGVGFTSFAAFSFSTIMGALGLYMNFYFAQYRQDKSLILKVIIFFVTIIAGISAGRASIAGFVFGLGFYYFTLGFRHYFTGAMRVGFYCLVLITPLIIYIMSVPALTEVVTSYYKYAFQFLHKYFYAGYVGRSSLDTLDKMYFPLTELQILWGDGKYTGSDGSYYLHTDPGFMRFTLIFGIFPSLVIYFGFLWVMFNYYVINRPYVKNIGVLILAIIGLSFVYHYKGELIMFNVSYMKLIYFIFVSCTLLSLKQKSS